jgi:hypothetical protein
VGRFISADSIVPSPSDPQDFNRYSYVGNNPLKYIDPTGHADWVGDTSGTACGVYSIEPYDDSGFDPWRIPLDLFLIFGDTAADVAEVVISAASGDWGGVVVSVGATLIPGVAARAVKKIPGVSWVSRKIDSGVRGVGGWLGHKIDETFQGIKRAFGAGGDEVVDDLPQQLHHFATNKSQKWTAQMEDIAGSYGLDLDDAWNKQLLPHQGRHPDAYHEWVLERMEEIDEIAQGDRGQFIQLFEELVIEPVQENPQMLRKSYWE